MVFWLNDDNKVSNHMFIPLSISKRALESKLKGEIKLSNKPKNLQEVREYAVFQNCRWQW